MAENFAPRAMRGFGLDYASLADEKPDLVMVSSCLQGQTGPHKDYPGFGGQGSALGGYNLLTGWPDREPVGPYGTITDSLAPRFVATALAAGLLYRRRTGRGVHLDVSQVEAAVYSLSPVGGSTTTSTATPAVAPGEPVRALRPPRRLPPARATTAGWRWPAGTTTTGARLADVIGVDEATTAPSGRPRGPPGGGGRDRSAGVGVDGDAQAPPTWPGRCRRRASRRCPWPTSATPRPTRSSPTGATSSPWTIRAWATCGYERNGFRLSDAPAGYERTSPALGEHNELVLGEILGLDGAERSRLPDDGVLE